MSNADTKNVQIGSSHGWIALGVSAFITTCVFFAVVYIGKDQPEILGDRDGMTILYVISGVISFFVFLISFVIFKIVFRKIHTKKTLNPPQNINSPTDSKNSLSLTKNKYAAIAVLSIVFVLLVVTNPNKQDFAMYAQNEIARGAQENNAGGLGALLGGIGAAFVVSSTVRDSYLLFSVYSTPSQGNTTKYIGLLGNFIQI